MAPCPHTVLLSLARAAKCNRHGGGIDESLARERKIKRRKRNFSLDLENLKVSISLSTLDFQRILESEEYEKFEVIVEVEVGCAALPDLY